MFNLANLFLTLNIATGVGANLTPICDRKNETSIIDYTQTLEQVNQSTQLYQQGTQPIPSNYSNFAYERDFEVETNYRSTSAYLNILASKYETRNRNVDTSTTFIQNLRTIENNYDDFWKRASTTFLIMQIDTYNFNVDTTIRITNTLNVSDVNLSNSDIQISNRKFLKQVYTTTDDWASYLQRTQTSYLAYRIREDIEDPNSNYFYTKNQELTNVLVNVSDQGYIQNDDTVLNLLPNTRNYIVIEYIPCAYASENDGNNITPITTDQAIMTYDQNNGITQTSYRITGTNVIPGTTYEVIDIPSIMWEILTMPFAFVSQAFNLTLFPGTPYQLNISNLFLSLIAIIVFVWLISFIIKLKG